jgi:hypothetical protein
MYLDHCAVQAHRFDPYTHNLSMLQFFKQAIEHATFRPAVHTCIDGVPIAEALGQPTPLTAMLGHVQDRIEHAQICVVDVTALLGQAVFDLGVLLLANFHALRLHRLEHAKYATEML